jgi:hypothetical protein
VELKYTIKENIVILASPPDWRIKFFTQEFIKYNRGRQQNDCEEPKLNCPSSR